MKIFITSVGTRGDIEPFLAVAELLQSHGHEIIYSFPIQFKGLLPKDARFYPLSAKFLELIDSKEGSTVMGNANVLKKLSALFKLYKKGKEVSRTIANEHVQALDIEKPDLIIQHPKCAVPFLWNLKYKVKIITLSPVPYVLFPLADHPHIGWPYNSNSAYIKLSYAVSKYAWVKQIHDVQKYLKGLFNYSKAEIASALFNNKFMYNISPQLFQRPTYWPKHVEVLGHHERHKSIEYNPPASLLQFIKTHEKILFLSFGSMVNYNPEKTSRCFYQVIDKLGMPCIVNTSSGGLIKLDGYAKHKNFYFVQDIPYDWLFKHVYAAIHHGGSGTTHMGLTHGLPTLIIPHIIDQFMWNRLVSMGGFGPRGISVNKVNSRRIEPLIKDLYTNEEYKLMAQNIAQKMQSEQLDEKLLDFIEN